MKHLSRSEILKYDMLYQKYPTQYGQVDPDEPRFMVAQNYLKSISGARTVLDAGVGRGGFYNLVKNEYDIQGIEPSEVAIEQFHRDDKRIKPLFIQELPDHHAEDSFDVVVCLDVLEHVPPGDIDLALSALACVGCKYFIFSIAHHSDVWDGMELHVANLPYEEWEKRLNNYFRILSVTSIHDDLSRVFILEKIASHPVLVNFEYDHQTFISLERERYEGNRRKAGLPLISVIIPTYNQAEFLSEALESVRAQTYPFWEAVVVNDGSSDETAQVMREYASKDQRIRIFHKENGGVASALNEGIRNARGEWICWLSSDDLFEKDKLQVHNDAIVAHPDIKFFHTHFYYLVEESGVKTEPDLWFPIPDVKYQVSRFFLGNYVHGNAVAIHRTVFDEVGLFNESLRQAQDFDMWLRISAKFQSHFIHKRTCITRIHKGQSTNSFPEGCYFDSAWACAKFLNRHSFAELFPLLDLRKELDARKVLLEAITLSITNDSFMNRCGFLSAFLDRANEWLLNECPRPLRPKLVDFISYALSKNDFSRVPVKTLEIIRRLGRNKQFTFRNVDFIAHLEKNAKELVEQGEQQKALLLEHYTSQILNRISTNDSSELRQKPFTPILLGFPPSNEYTPLTSDNVLSWFIEPLTYFGCFRHTLQVQCLSCGQKFPFVTELLTEEKAQEVQIICPNCKRGYTFSDGKIDRYSMSKAQPTITKRASAKGEKPKVTCLARGIHGKSGGTMVFAKHIQWLADLGCDVVVYSDSPKPLWINLPGKFVRVKDFREVDPGNVDLVVLYCMFELPLMVKKIDPSKIVYICQAYEGYLYGRNFSELRADKAFFTALHSLPINVIAVSQHLKDLFEKKFRRTPYYVPNSVDHSIFKPDPAVQKESSFILFIGNPYHPLKGFDFLSTTINNIQKSTHRIDNLKLIVATGISSSSDEHTQEDLERVLDCKVVFKRGLSNKEIAALMNAVDMVVCTSWYEGFSLILVEAMACGTPVITTKNMGAESFCVNGYNSFVVEYGDVNHLGSAILSVLANPASLTKMKVNALKTSLEYSDANSFNLFVEAYSKLLDRQFDPDLIKKLHDDLWKTIPVQAKNGIVRGGTFVAREKFSVTYLISSILGVTGGNQTLLKQANALVDRGHQVTIVTHSDKPPWFNIKARVCKVPEGESMAKYVPPCDVAVSTYFTNTSELNDINAPVKIYFAQGDQFIFEDESVRSTPELESIRSHLKELSRTSYQDSNIRLVVNSKTLTERIYQKHGRTADAVLNVGIDENIFRPLPRAARDSRLRILIVGPDVLGTELEPLTFKGMLDVRKALERLSKKTKNFTVVRMSNSEPSIFKDFPCEFYIAPNEELKTFLYGTAHILVYASHYESWGLPPLEAMASGAAVICTATPAAIEYCRDRENCLLVPPKSPDALYRAIDTLLTDHRLREHIVEGGFETAKLYTKKREWDELEKLLYTFLGESGVSQKLPPAASRLETSSQSNQKFVALLSEAVRLFEETQYQSAVAKIEEAEKLLQEGSSTLLDGSFDAECEVDLYDLKGHSFLGLNDLEQAKDAFEQALQRNPNSSEACAGLGEAFYRAAMDRESKMMFEWAVKNDRSNERATAGLAAINQQLGYQADDNSLLVDAIEVEEPNLERMK